MLVVLCSSVIALLYNVVHSLLIKRTSAVTVTVLGEVKVVGLLVLSAIVLGKVHYMQFVQLHHEQSCIAIMTDIPSEACSMNRTGTYHPGSSVHAAMSALSAGIGQSCDDLI